IGEDCAGAVQLVRAERLDDVLGEAAPEVEWLSEMAVARRLTDIVEHHGTGRTAGDPGYFSLAGAQPKTALIYSDGRWGVPSGRLPTTHILKPSTQRDLPGFEVNEHFCLRLAEEVGVPVAESRVLRFDDQIAIVVSRYDRAKLPSGEIRRVHQEDACQALSVSPSRKYEAEGGPGAASLVDLLLEEADDPEVDVGTLIDALALNWVIGGTDAHAKNYSLLIRPGSVRLAPLYDLVSALPYPHWIPYRKAKLAMRVDREYAIHKVRARHWRALAEHCGLDAGPVVDRVGEIVDQVQGAIGAVAASLHEEGLNDPIIGDLADAISSHAERCLDHLSA
ncbi:MAG: HipA domain-containing protein, partial [Longimicrobiales bacterium]